MKTIRPAFATVAGVCGSQKVKANVEYIPSRHCLRVPCQAGELLYHALTGALVLLPKGLTGESDREELIKNWFLVPEDFDEIRHVDDVKRIVAMLKPSVREKTNFTILTTTDCNARCFYCYELGIRRFPMAEKTAREVALYIARACGGKRVSLRWFGGEPLYNRQAIDTICKTLGQNGISYESSMVSNGFYLDEQTARKAVVDWRLTKAQITIDGTETIYNRTKAYIDAEQNPYARVMGNIQSALSVGIAVTIRLNMDARNAWDLLRLLDDVKARFEGSDNLDIYIALLHEFEGKIHRHETDRQAEEAYGLLRDKAEAMGMLRRKPLSDGFPVNYCMADSEACETILPDGRTGRCEHFSEAMVTGNIRDEGRDEAVTKRWKEPLRVPECGVCALYPQCRKLKLCEWNEDGCSGLDRAIKTDALKREILEAYREYKKGEDQK